jgi:hypothetical protein
MIPSWITQTPEAGVTADSFLKSVVDSFTGYMSVYNLQKALAQAMEFSEGLVTF